MNLKLPPFLPAVLLGAFAFFLANSVIASSPSTHLDLTEALHENITALEEITVSGTISDEYGEAMIGVSVLEKGTGTGTVSGVSGNYSLVVSDGATLVFSYIGFKTQEVLVAGRSVIDVVISEDVSALDAVIVVGYGRQQKRDITGSVVTLSSTQIKDIPVTSFENAIQGQMAGVQVSETSGEPGAGPTIRVRGLGSISAGNEPLYVIDGFPISKNVDLGVQGDNFRRGAGRFRPPTQNPLGTLNPNDIESIQVLKDASSASIYGSRGSNGVVLITTKKGKRQG
ncbi:MAG: TonB-dependent SusC/RagA subfamily outer membrane receptor, partial [Saprospiraceae bacterium]